MARGQLRFDGGPAILDARTGSFASLPRGGFACYG